MLTLMDRLFPAAADRMMVTGGAMFRSQKSNHPKRTGDNMFQASDTHRVRGGYPAARSSLYTRVFEQHPNVKRLAIAGAAIGVVALVMQRQRFSSSDWHGRRSARLASTEELRGD